MSDCERTVLVDAEAANAILLAMADIGVRLRVRGHRRAERLLEEGEGCS